MEVSMRRVLSQRSKLAILILALSPITSAYAIHYQGPLVVDDAYVKKHGRVIVGNFAGTISQPALTINTATPVLITDSNFTGPGDLISAFGADISVTNSTGVTTNPNIYGQQKGFAIKVQGALNVNLQNNTFTGPIFGVYIAGWAGTPSSTQTVKILHNVFNNIDGRPSDGNGGYFTDGQWNAHGIQLNGIPNIPYMEIAWNQIINTPLQSQCSDIINIFKSGGTSTSHLIIHDNYVQGAFPANPGPDGYSGGGIITDGTAQDTAANTTAFVDMYSNQVVATANYGLSIATGHDNSIYNNRIVSSGYLANGAFYPTTYGNGINNYNNYGQPPTVMFNDIAYNNLSGLVRKSSTGGPMRADWYLPNQTTGSNTNWTPNDSAHPTLADEANEFVLWQQKLGNNKISIGAVNKG
jgi:hypothetical protein